MALFNKPDAETKFSKALDNMVEKLDELVRTSKQGYQDGRDPFEKPKGMEKLIKTFPKLEKVAAGTSKGLGIVSKVSKRLTRAFKVASKVSKGLTTTFKVASKAYMWAAGIITAVVGLLSAPFRKLRWAIEVTQDAMRDLGLKGLKTLDQGMTSLFTSMQKGMGETGKTTAKLMMVGALQPYSDTLKKAKEDIDTFTFVTGMGVENLQNFLHPMLQAGANADEIRGRLAELASGLVDSGANIPETMDIINEGLMNSAISVADVPRIIRMSATGPAGQQAAKEFIAVQRELHTYTTDAFNSFIQDTFGTGAGILQGDLKGFIREVSKIVESGDSAKIAGLAKKLGTSETSVIELARAAGSVADTTSRTLKDLEQDKWKSMSFGEALTALTQIFTGHLLPVIWELVGDQMGGLPKLRDKIKVLGEQFGTFISDSWGPWMDKIPKIWELLEKGINSFVISLGYIGARFGFIIGEELYKVGVETGNKTMQDEGFKMLGISAFPGFGHNEKERGEAYQRVLRDPVRVEQEYQDFQKRKEVEDRINKLGQSLQAQGTLEVYDKDRLFKGTTTWIVGRTRTGASGAW